MGNHMGSAPGRTGGQQLIVRLLLSVVDEELKRSDLDPRFAEIFQHLAPSAALIESCWRQFVFEGGQVTFLRSNAGSVGLMQINQNVLARLL